MVMACTEKDASTARGCSDESKKCMIVNKYPSTPLLHKDPKSRIGPARKGPVRAAIERPGSEVDSEDRGMDDGSMEESAT
jgi:hypothetical protein